MQCNDRRLNYPAVGTHCYVHEFWWRSHCTQWIIRLAWYVLLFDVLLVVVLSVRSLPIIHRLRIPQNLHTHTHTHTHIYIYKYIYSVNLNPTIQHMPVGCGSHCVPLLQSWPFSSCRINRSMARRVLYGV